MGNSWLGILLREKWEWPVDGVVLRGLLVIYRLLTDINGASIQRQNDYEYQFQDDGTPNLRGAYLIPVYSFLVES